MEKPITQRHQLYNVEAARKELVIQTKGESWKVLKRGHVFWDINIQIFWMHGKP